MGKSPENKPDMAFGLFRKPREGESGAGHIISNNPELTAQIIDKLAAEMGADVVVVKEGPLPDGSSRRSFSLSGLNWENSEWQPSGSAWISTKLGHA